MARKSLGAASSGATDIPTRAEVQALIAAASGGGAGFASTAMEATNGVGQDLSNNSAFNTIALSSTITDTGGNYNAGTSIYTVPSTGLYLCLGQTRIQDGTGTGGAGFGLGIHTSTSDGVWFLWTAVPTVQRRIVPYRRLSRFTAGDQLRLFYYYDGSGSGTLQLSSMQIVRIA